MKRLYILYNSPWPAFLLMVLGNIVFGIISFADGSMQKQMGQAVDYLKEGYSGEERDLMILSFIAISVAVYLATTTACAISLRFTQKGRKLGLAIFVCVSASVLYQTASSPYVLSSMYPGTVTLTDWVVAIVQSLVWCFVIGLSVRQFLSARSKSLGEAV